MSTSEAIVGFRLSPQQRRLWPLLSAVGSSPFVAQCLVVIDRTLESGRLAEALAAVTSRHEILRTTFRLLPGMTAPLQVIGEQGTFRLRTEDLTDGVPAERQARLADLAQRARRQTFDLENGPLLDALLVRLTAESRVLVLTLPALCADALGVWSLAREISAAALGGPAPAEPIQYADVSEVLNRLLESEETREGREHWSRAAASRLAAARQVAAGNGSSASFVPRTVSVPAQVEASLLALAAELSAPPAGVLLACWYTLLWRSGLAEVPVVAVAHEGRGFEGLEETIGLFERYLPMTVDPTPDLPFRQLVSRVVADLADSRDRQDYFSWETASGEAETAPDLAFLPFAFEHRAPRLFNSADRGWEIREIHALTEPFLARLSYAERQSGLGVGVSLQYDAARLARWEAERLTERLAVLVASAAAEPGDLLGDLEAAGEAERHQVLVEWNDTATDLPAQPLHRMFEAQAARTPEDIAVEQESTQLTYAELAGWSARLARRLWQMGAGPGVVVAVCSERSPALVAGLLGVLRSGAAYLPLDPDYPPERLAYMLEDSRAPILLTPSSFHGTLPQTGARWLSLDDPGLDEAAVSSLPVPEVAMLADPAYVIYTSGSTGRPKGVMVSHGAITNRLLWMQRRFPLLPSDAVLQKTPVSFDASIWELFLPLATGARLILARPRGQRDTAYLTAVVADRKVTVLQLVPSLLAQFVEDPGIERCASLRRLFCGGEALAADLVDRFSAHLKAEVVNLYGPTEAAIDATCTPCITGVRRSGPVPIGRPLDNVQVHLLNESLRPVLAGAPGELCIGGVGLALGYLGRSELTAERFVPDPYSGVPGARLYRTGDLARYLLDGTIEFLGRLDNQVKVRGFRIEPGEVEAVLAGHPGVRQAVVGVSQLAEGAARLTAWVVPAPEGAPSVADLRIYLSQRLPEHLVPSVFITLGELPLTSSGKLDRRALPAPGTAAASEDRVLTAPRTPAEEILAGIWKDILQLERVGVHDNFFELGGDSILSIQIVARANRAGLRLAPRQIFEHQTIAALAAVAGVAPATANATGTVRGPVLLTPIQHAYLDREPADPHHYNQAVLLEVAEPLDGGALATAARTLVEHHDALRLRFEHSGAEWRQIAAGPEEVADPFHVVDFSALPATLLPAAIERTAAAVQTSFDLGRPPLVRMTLMRCGDTADRLFLAMHHLVVDGVSWRILIEDLEAAYRQAVEPGRTVELPARTASFQTWAERLRTAATEITAEDRDFWLAERWRRARPLPVDHPGGVNTAGSTRRVVVRLEAEDTRALLERVPAAYRTQINDSLLTALAQTFELWTGERALLVDLEGHGREESFGSQPASGEAIDLSRTVGWLTSVSPVLLAPGGGTPGDALKRVKEQLREIGSRRLQHGLLRFLGDAGIRERLHDLPVPEVAFNYLGQLDKALPGSSPFRPAREAVGGVRSPRQERQYLIEVDGGVSGGRLQLVWTYSENIHRRETIERLASGFAEALRTLIAYCLSPEAGGYTPSDFPLAGLEQEDLDRLLAGRGQIEDLYPLSPLQQGLLFHALDAPGSGVYFVQWSCGLEGELDLPTLQSAWLRVAERHPALRTAFLWDDGVDMLQLVAPRAELPWEVLDWRDLAEEEQRERLTFYLDADRQRGFDLSRPPLMRFALARLGEQSYRFIWSHHHLVLDGWCLPILLGEVLALYEGLRSGAEPRFEPARPYREYIEWLRGQDLTEAEAFWRRSLEGFSTPTPLAMEPVAERNRPAERFGDLSLLLPEDVTTALDQVARRHRLTLNTLAQAAYGLLLSRDGGSSDVVFGATVSGRPPELPGVESMVGLFINTLPVRVRVTREISVLSWLENLQEQQVQARQYEHSPLLRIQEWSQVPAGQPLFEAILTFENFPVDTSVRERTAGLSRLRVHGIRHHGRNSNPLTLLAAPGVRMGLTLLHDRFRWKERTILRMLHDLQMILTEFASAPERSLGDLLARLDEQANRRLEAEGGELNSASRDRLRARLRQPREVRT